MQQIGLVTLAFIISILAASQTVNGQGSLTQAQDKEFGANSQPRILTQGEKEVLGDPLFNLVLRDHADETALAAIQNLIQPDAGERQVFAVEEHIGTDKFGGRRAVIAFTGEHNGESLTGNVMLSIIFGPQSFPTVTNVEGWGWDNQRGRYNYYKLDTNGGGLTWKFRGSSVDADFQKNDARRGTCMACHVNGAPIMKELPFPWNNWHSNLAFSARYLSGQFAPSPPWPISNDPPFKNHLKGAQVLEGMIIPSIRRFNITRVDAGLKRNDNGSVVVVGGKQTITEGTRLLKPLFRATEFNIASARQRSGLDPWTNTPAGPTQDIIIPNSFFLNVGLIAGGGGVTNYKGLRLVRAKDFNDVGLIRKDEYRTLVEEFGLRMNQLRGRDALFAWFVPEHSHIDIDLIDRLLRRGVITPHFLAAALSVDLEEPLYLSEKRAALLRFIPDEFEFVPILSDTIDPNDIPRDPAKDKLTQMVIAAIEAVTAADRSDSDKRFLERLKATDARALLSNDVDAYLARVSDKLGSSNADVRTAEVRRLFKKSLDLRKAVLRDRTFRTLDETRGTLLFPLP